MQAEVTATPAPMGGTRTVRRLRAVAVCVALTALAFLQDPGLTVVDTKVDLTVNPLGWLERSLHLWNSTTTFGQLQDQAYGYLWPMGPFFEAGSWLGMPAWVIQRLWWALLMCVAFTGLVRLADRLGIGTPTARLIAGVAFALSPRVLTQLGWSSIEAWPSAVAPWVLVPLVGLTAGASLRRAVTRSALAVACAGGVNATAVLAVVPLALLWLGTVAPLRRRMAAILAWCLAVGCATAWWVLPLLILGKYSPSFLNYIENAEVTTRLTDSVTNMRGASYWLAYLGGPYGPALPAGWRLATDPVLVVATVVVATFGLVGLSRRGLPHRRFLVTGLLAGLALVGLGHVSALDATIAGPVRQFLDGLGAPLRNAHKFDVVLRIPLVLGLAHLIGVLSRAGGVVRNGIRTARVPAALAIATVVAAVAGVASPALAGGLAPRGGYKEVPGYWQDAADWLDAREGRGRVLVLPAASSPHYTWGRTSDEILQPLLEGPWAVRNAIPLTPPTTIRLLDAVESVLSTGGGSAGLADLLARSGVRFVLLRSDIDYGRSATTRPLIARQALERSPGLTLVAGFGPVLGGPRPFDAFIDRGLNVAVRPLEVFEVDRAVDPVVAFDTSDVTTVVGGPESLLSLAAAGQLTAAPTVFAGDLPRGQALGHVVLTDGLRRREVAFGHLHDNASPTLTANEPYDTVAPAHDYLPSWGAEYATTVRYDGIAGVRAKTSWAQANAVGGARPEHQPFAALDGNAATSWRPAPGTFAEGQWLEVEFEEPRTVPEMRLRFDVGAGSFPTKLTVAAGIERVTVDSFGDSVVIRLPGIHATRTVRVTVDAVLGFGTLGISEIEIPGLRAGRTLVVPTGPYAGEPASVVLSAGETVPSCFFFEKQPRCSPETARGSEDGNGIDRTLMLPRAGSYEPKVWARPQPGAMLNAVLDEQVAIVNAGEPPAVTASSTSVADPVGRPGAVIDGDPTTAWSPAASDANPLLRLTWATPRVIEGLRLTLAPEVAATRPATVRVVGDDGVRGGFVFGDGVVVFDPPMRTDEITILVLDPPRTQSYDPYRNVSGALPIAVGEVTPLPDASRNMPDLDTRVDLACGSGPTLEAGRARIPTRMSTTLRDLLELREVVAEPCTTGDDVRMSLPAGELRVIASGSDLAAATRIALVPDVPRTSATATAVRLGAWSASSRQVHVDAHEADRILAVRENINAGWQATASGRVLTPIVVDGWQQGWLLPAGVSGDIVLKFVPDALYRGGLAGGAALLVGVLLLAVLPSRRSGSHAPRVVVTRRPRGRAAPLLVGGVSLIVVGGALGGVVVFGGIVAMAYQLLPVTAMPAKPAEGERRRMRRVLRAIESWLPGALLLVGGWLSLTVEDHYLAAGPQAAGLLAVGALWLSVVVSPSHKSAGTPPLEGLLQEVVAGGGEQQPAAEGHEIRAQQVSREERPVLDEVDQLKYQQVPQEQPVRDLAEPTRRGAAQRFLEAGGWSERRRDHGHYGDAGEEHHSHTEFPSGDRG